jgi:hypothetical protein
LQPSKEEEGYGTLSEGLFREEEGEGQLLITITYLFIVETLLCISAVGGKFGQSMCILYILLY